MRQEAILFTRINAVKIAADLNDYPTAEELLEDYKYELEAHHVVVLVRDILDDGFSSVSYVVTQNLFERNNPGITISTEHFTRVRNV